MANDGKGADIRIIQAVHDTFRTGLTRLIDATAKLEPSALASTVGPYWNFYSAILDYHHHNEDDEDFPLLASYYPDIQPLVDQLGAEHRQMLEVMARLNTAVASFEKAPDAAGRDAIHAAAIELRDLFFPHLDREDAEVLPMYAKWIPPDVWDKLEKKALKNIPKPQMAYAVGGLDETIWSMPESERPDGPPLPLKIFLALSWRKKWAALSDPLRT